MQLAVQMTGFIEREYEGGRKGTKNTSFPLSRVPPTVFPAWVRKEGGFVSFVVVVVVLFCCCFSHKLHS